MDTSPRVGNDAELFLATAESVRLEHRIRGMWYVGKVNRSQATGVIVTCLV